MSPLHLLFMFLISIWMPLENSEVFGFPIGRKSREMIPVIETKLGDVNEETEEKVIIADIGDGEVVIAEKIERDYGTDASSQSENRFKAKESEPSSTSSNTENESVIKTTTGGTSGQSEERTTQGQSGEIDTQRSNEESNTASLEGSTEIKTTKSRADITWVYTSPSFPPITEQPNAENEVTNGTILKYSREQVCFLLMICLSLITVAILIMVSCLLYYKKKEKKPAKSRKWRRPTPYPREELARYGSLTGIQNEDGVLVPLLADTDNPTADVEPCRSKTKNRNSTPVGNFRRSTSPLRPSGTNEVGVNASPSEIDGEEDSDVSVEMFSTSDVEPSGSKTENRNSSTPLRRFPIPLRFSGTNEVGVNASPSEIDGEEDSDGSVEMFSTSDVEPFRSKTENLNSSTPLIRNLRRFPIPLRFSRTNEVGVNASPSEIDGEEDSDVSVVYDWLY